MRAILLGLLLTLCLPSCTPASPQTRIAENGGMYSLLSAKDRELVAAGEIREGMPKDAVYLAWGTPSRIYQMEEDGAAKERWVYTRSKPTQTTTTTIGIGYSGHPRYRRYGHYGGVGYGPRTVYIPEKVGEAIFVRNKVESWEHRK